MTDLRPYQSRAVESVHAAWSHGSQAVCLVAPTGSGKTVIGSHIANAHDGPVLWLAHRRELVEQARAALGNPAITVDTVQRLLASGERPAASLVVFDEAHHYVAAKWRAIATAYAGVRYLGLTATPERSDGTALGDMFGTLVVAAQYRELIHLGHIVDCEVWSPAVENRRLAARVCDGYDWYCEGKKTLVFTRLVREAYEYATDLGWSCEARAVEGSMRRLERDALVQSFRDGPLDVLTNVFLLTEGFDSPDAEAVILARLTDHHSTYLQMVGRALRPAPGKTQATVVDLTGNLQKHGFPTDDKEYSLSGKAIKNKRGLLWQCRHCGLVLKARPRGHVCPSCKNSLATGNAVEKYEVSETDLHRHSWVDPEVIAKQLELRRARELLRLRDTGKDAAWVARKFAAIFGEKPPGDWVLEEEREPVEAIIQAPARGIETARHYYDQQVKLAIARGYKPGWAAHRFKAKFGRWPPRHWQ